MLVVVAVELGVVPAVVLVAVELAAEPANQDPALEEEALKMVDAVAAAAAMMMNWMRLQLLAKLEVFVFPLQDIVASSLLAPSAGLRFWLPNFLFYFRRIRRSADFRCVRLFSGYWKEGICYA